MKLINTSFNELIKGKKLTFLVGAGCSVNPPSCLPTGKEMMNDIIKFSCSENFKEDIRKLITGKTLRFEQLVEIFVELIDKNMHCIDFFSECKYPNSIHFFLAHMIKRGHFVITTNFDSLIEHALIETGIPKDLILPVITKYEFLKYNNPKDIFKGGKFPLYKIHGSPIDIIKNTSKSELRESLIVTIKSFVQDKKGLSIFELEPYKQEAVENLLKNRTLVVMGYSGSDDFDIMPTLESVKGINEIIWISHDDTQDLKIWELERLDIDDPKQDIEIILNKLKKARKNISIFEIEGLTEKIISESNLVESDNLSERFDLKPFQWISRGINTPSEIEKIQMCYLIYEKFSFFTKELVCIDMIEEIAKKEKNLYWLSVAYHNKASIMLVQGSYDKALACSDKAYRINKKSPSLPKYNLLNLIVRGTIFHRRGQLRKAQEIMNEAINVAKKLNDEITVANIHNSLGIITKELGENDISGKNFRFALSLFERNNNPIGKSVVLLSLAINYRNKGDYEQEANYLQIATQVSEKLSGRHYQSACYTELGHYYLNTNDLEKALFFYNKTYDLAIDMGDKNRQADILRSIGNLLSRHGRLNDALEKYEESYQINIEIGSKQGEAGNLEDIGYVFERNGDLSKAIECYEKALDINQEIGYYGKILNNHNSLGLGFHKMKNLEKATNHYQICEGMMDKVEDPLVLCNFYLNFSSLLIDLSKNDEASEYLRLAKELCVKFTMKSNLMQLNANFGKLREKKGNYEKAIFYYKKALEIAKEFDFKRDEARYLNKLGRLYKELGKFDKALDHYERALSITEILDDHYGEANILFNMGYIHNKEANYDQALNKLLEAKNLIKQHNINEIELNNKINNAIKVVKRNINWIKSNFSG